MEQDKSKVFELKQQFFTVIVVNIVLFLLQFLIDKN